MSLENLSNASRIEIMRPMQTQLHQFIATLLLCSLTLQSQPSYGVNGMPRQQNNAAGSAAMLEALQPEELSEFGIRSPLGLPGKLYSSDEEDMLSDAQSEENIALLQDGAMEAGFWIVAPEAKVLQLAYKLGKAVKLGTKITKGGKVLIQITDKVVSKEAKVAIAKAGGRVVEKGLWKLTKEKAISIKACDRLGSTLYKSKTDGLWWAAVKGEGHGDAFKVFKETEKGLEWMKDADKFGNFIINKHKGPKGLFISYKELRTIK